MYLHILNQKTFNKIHYPFGNAFKTFSKHLLFNSVIPIKGIDLKEMVLHMQKKCTQ